MSQEDFISSYLEYQKNTESPTIYHRWCAISAIATSLGRRVWFQFGDTQIFPNMYIMLVGEPGARKSTAIKKAVKFLEAAKFECFAPRKTTKEKFLLDFEAGFDHMENEEEDALDVTKGPKKNQTMKELFGQKEVTDNPQEVLIAADEFAVFTGHGNVEFLDILTDLWDYEGIYRNRIKNGVSVRIPFPTANILSGNTDTNISVAFPQHMIGQGIFSRMILTFGEATGRRITVPKPGDPALRKLLEEHLTKISQFMGEIFITPGAYNILDEIYQGWVPLEDIRFKYYSSRRIIHLIKLCIVQSVSRGVITIDADDIIMANTVLHYTESFMPKALGEFGKAKNSDISAKILEIIDGADRPLHPIKDIWPKIRQDLDTQRQFLEILNGLAIGGKIQQLPNGILPLKKVQEWKQTYCKIDLLKEYHEDQEKRGL